MNIIFLEIESLNFSLRESFDNITLFFLFVLLQLSIHYLIHNIITHILKIMYWLFDTPCQSHFLIKFLCYLISNRECIKLRLLIIPLWICNWQCQFLHLQPRRSYNKYPLLLGFLKFGNEIIYRTLGLIDNQPLK